MLDTVQNALHIVYHKILTITPIQEVLYHFTNEERETQRLCVLADTFTSWLVSRDNCFELWLVRIQRPDLHHDLLCLSFLL